MATNIKGPAIFLAQFAGDTAPHNSFDSITKWAGSLGYKGVQIPTWDGRLFDLKKAAESKTYCDEVKGIAKANGVEITELSTHLQGQLVAVNPAYDEAFDALPGSGSWQAKGEAEMGGRAIDDGGQGLQKSWADIDGVIHRCTCLALYLSLATTPARLD
jgi:sugar phosphate isomerase/epimerase